MKYKAFVLLIVGAFLMSSITVILSGCGKKEETVDQTGQPAMTDTTATESTAQQAVEKPPAQTKPAEAKTEPKQPPAPKFAKVTIPDSTELAVVLADTVQTNVNQVGDIFGGTLAKPVIVGDRVVFPEGSKVKCEITHLVKGGTMKTPPELAFVITEVITPDGKSYPVVVDTLSDQGRSHTARQVGMIGGGAAAGAVIGGILGKTKGAAIGAAVGAAAGTGAAAATGRQNLVYPAGETVSFTLQQQLTVSLPVK